MPDELRIAIRAILREELAKVGADSATGRPQVIEERVRIGSDQDLAKFVRRLLALCADPGSRKAIETGRHVFKMGKDDEPMPKRQNLGQAGRMLESEIASFESGLITEKEIRKLPDSASRVRVAKGVRVTPLALDALRKAGIKLERMSA
ncbi:MAG: hypothetical protein OXI87_20990 [Albidovulum sp.]|nr:hypothetical protein [Albidovulum sp.]MDE0307331.1 hypothetical protein [Albidovulum sp.]MDE0531696.1 hypothetical protein [Albidovulum sp.]